MEVTCWKSQAAWGETSWLDGWYVGDKPTLEKVAWKLFYGNWGSLLLRDQLFQGFLPTKRLQTKLLYNWDVTVNFSNFSKPFYRNWDVTVTPVPKLCCWYPTETPTELANSPSRLFVQVLMKADINTPSSRIRGSKNIHIVGKLNQFIARKIFSQAIFWGTCQKDPPTWDMLTYNKHEILVVQRWAITTHLKLEAWGVVTGIVGRTCGWFTVDSNHSYPNSRPFWEDCPDSPAKSPGGDLGGLQRGISSSSKHHCRALVTWTKCNSISNTPPFNKQHILQFLPSTKAPKTHPFQPKLRLFSFILAACSLGPATVTHIATFLKDMSVAAVRMTLFKKRKPSENWKKTSLNFSGALFPTSIYSNQFQPAIGNFEGIQ